MVNSVVMEQREHEERFISKFFREPVIQLLMDRLEAEKAQDYDMMAQITEELVQNVHYFEATEIYEYCIENGISAIDFYLDGEYDDSDVEDRFVLDLATYIINKRGEA